MPTPRCTINVRALIDALITKLKGEPFRIDPAIPLGHIAAFLVGRVLSLLHGMLVFRTFRRVFLHPSASVTCASKIQFGDNLSIARGCHVNALSREGLILGRNVSMGPHTQIELTGGFRNIGKGMVVGDNVGLGTHGLYGSGVGGLRIGNDTIIGNYVTFHPESHVHSDLGTPIRLQGVEGQGIVIGANCWIGAKATFLDGTVLGDGCIVGAGSVVRGAFPDNMIIAGVPARIIRARAKPDC